ncbi:MAG: hypothetical protein AABX59_02980 [Nanoarchaeota archaeon]
MVYPKNVERALDAYLTLIKKGHFPYLPHLTHFVHLHSDELIPWEVWIEQDEAWLEVC